MFYDLFRKNKLFLFSFLILCNGILVDLKANNIISNNNNFLRNQKPISAPNKVNNKNDLLLVSLKPYLGQFANEDITTEDLKLLSAGENLILRDSKGIIHKSSNIVIGWEKKYLKTPFNVVRKIRGPFSSFESAQQFAKKLENLGIQSVIAHPKNWEVWVPQHVHVPKKFDMKTFVENVDFVVQPVLKVRGNKLLLLGPISIEANNGLLWGGGIYRGPFLLKPDAYGSWTFIEQLRLSEYLKGVVPHEIGSASPQNALAAQAVLARTWAVANSHRFRVDGYHLCSNTQCQVYKNPNEATDEVIKAIEQTVGKVLIWNNKPIHAVYHATNGGVMGSASEAWSMSSLPYLVPVFDGPNEWRDKFRLPLQSNSELKHFLSYRQGAFGTNHYRFRWRRVLTAKEIKNALTSFSTNFDVPISVKVHERGVSGRVIALQIVGSQNSSQIIIRLDNIRRIFKNLPSTLFVVNQLREGVWEFSGGGFGHGVGLSQAGAIDLAGRGWSVQKILMHYYPGTEYETLP